VRTFFEQKVAPIANDAWAAGEFADGVFSYEGNSLVAGRAIGGLSAFLSWPTMQTTLRFPNRSGMTTVAFQRQGGGLPQRQTDQELDLQVSRTVFREDHEMYRGTVRRFLERECVPRQAEWDAAGQVDMSSFEVKAEVGQYAAGATKHYHFKSGEFMIYDLENIGSTELVFVTVEHKNSNNEPLPLNVS
jgi:hypothetical protein